MKKLILPVIVVGSFILCMSFAGGLFAQGYETLAPTDQYRAVLAQPVMHPAPYGYGGGYDPFGPITYSSWGSSRCFNCSQVWDGYGCHEFCRKHQGGCYGARGGKCHHRGAGGCVAGSACQGGNCAVEAASPASGESAPTEAPLEDPSPEGATEPPIPESEQTTSRRSAARPHG